MQRAPTKLALLLASMLALTMDAALAAPPSLPNPALSHSQAVAAARAGQYEDALAALERLTRDFPHRQAYLHDRIAVLSWAGRYGECLAASDAVRLSVQTPDYVLAAIGKAALSTQQTARAQQAYGLLRRQQPGNADAALGLALALLDGNQPQLADVQLAHALRLANRQAPMLASAYTALATRGDAPRSAPFRVRLQALGRPVPDITTTATVAVGAPSVASATATSSVVNTPAAMPLATAVQPTVLGSTTSGPAAIAASPSLADAQARNAQHIRDAEVVLDVDFSSLRYREVDAALSDNAALITRAEAENDAGMVLRLRRDRVVALRDRGSMAQAIAEFRALDSASGPAPSYVVRAAADAYLTLREPEVAISLYQRVLQSEPGDAGAQSGLMYAQIEAENFPAAEDIVNGRLQQSGGALASRRTQAMLLRFADRPKDAQTEVDALAAQYPDNAGVWLEQAELLANRGMPRAAEERYRAVLAQSPDNIHARVGLANARWAQGDVPEVARMVRALQADAPEHPAVQRLVHAWQRHRDAPVLSTGITKGFGQGAVAGNNDLLWESSLYSGQYESGLRVFANHHLSKATFNGDSASHERVGMGVEWTQRDLQASAEVGRDLRNGQDMSWAAGIGYQLNDQLSVRARHESQTNDFSVKARLPDGEAYLGAPTYLHADRTVIGAAYRWNESRRVAADFANYNFNDGNHRQSFAASWFERLYSGYGKTLDLQGSAYTSSNTLRDALYFNPQRDTALSATLTGDWLTWRRYERSFNQRVAVTLGSYQQLSDLRQNGQWVSHNYGWNPFYEVRYEHEWNWGPDLNARYGVGWRRFPYDGVQENKGYIYLHLRYRF